MENIQDYEALLSENKSLKEQLSSMQYQIDALQKRSHELMKQNSSMQRNLLKMEKSKNDIEELQTKKDELFTLIIHDIKNPVALIKQLVELLSSYDLTATEQQEIIKDIANTTAKIINLSQEVSKIMTLESKHLTLNYDNVQITDIILDVYQRNLIAAKNKNIKLIADRNPNIPKALLDPQKTDEILDNLVSNAIKFTQKGGTIIIKSEIEKDYLIISVSDNGLGISEDDIKNAFKLGSRLSARPTGDEPSTGLGLWIVKKLVEAHNGRVWAKSALGKGSTFYVSIPFKSPKD